MKRPRGVGPLALFVAAGAWSVACRRDPPAAQADVDAAPATSAMGADPPPAHRVDPNPPRPGMAFVPAGTLRAGTPPGRIPRVADEESPGTPVQMQGFYIDLLPYPNEPGAIPTTNVTRDEAEQTCASKGKRLCSELEWERACKGAANTTYEYGDAYRAAACGTGVSAEEAARRPGGEHAQCKSGFGVADLHGGVWQWTASRWGRGSNDGSLGVLRGGNAVAGELVGRCANAIGRPISKRSPTMGFRCCAGAKNDAEVKLKLRHPPGLFYFPNPSELGTPYASELGEGMALTRTWKWRPVANDELVVVIGCRKHPAPACALVVGRTEEGGAEHAVVLRTEAGASIPDLARLGDARHLRVRSLDPIGMFSREITYVYGRVDLGDLRRP